ncbi:RidA family protein [Thalassomonas haliotis]|uniref:RidA family protein n=1 Tax=Thalassomonas haliotis TaxID=485448 RepID=A0ABY7VE17_9GAMM|nr:RidA family protein [Thalassomonas haliotis]WDE11230.1 RidA family protein [Thalassomonas haliotis]
MIERKPGIYPGRNKSSAYKDLVWTVATSSDTDAGIEEQTRLTLETIEQNLLELASDKSRIVSAQVYIANMQDKAKMDAVWQSWLGTEPQHWPQRACLGVALEGKVLIEVTVTAVRDLSKANR